MGPRGKFRKGKHQKNFRKKFSKDRKNKDKSFSVIQNKSHNKKISTKRPNERNTFNPETKRPKIEKEEYSPSSEEEEEENHMKQLLETFGPNLVNKKNLAIDSSDESVSDENSEGEDLDKVERTSDESESDEEEEAEVSNPKSYDKEQSEKQDLDSESEICETDIIKTNETGSKIHSHSENDIQETFVEEDEVDVETQKEDEDTSGDLNDPFARHLFYELGENLLDVVQNGSKTIKSHTLDWPALGKLHVQIPYCEETKKTISQFNIAGEQHFAPLGGVPIQIHNSDDCTLNSLHVKTQIIDNIASANKSRKHFSEKLPLTQLQSEIFSIINNYQDLYFASRTFENAEEIRFVYCLHIINHILKTRTKVLHHNARLNKKSDVPEQFRDQGLVRPKILVIVPFRDSAYKIISMLIDILITEDKGNVMNKNRFMEEFTGHELVMPKKNPKPEDYEMLFTGNTGDDFRIGVTVTKKSLKLFADFYSSDIIIASPLGLRTIIGAEGEPERDHDFLASIELLILDQIEIFLMQNWDHMLHILKHLHLQPKESHGTDFSRVRTWNLNGWAKYYRQTLLFSSFVLPEINSIFNKKCFNYAGKVKTTNLINLGSICQVFLQLPHVFHKFGADNVTESVDARFNFFITKILPQQRETLMRQTLIFVSNYFDFVRLRNYFKREDIGFVQICEYSKDGKVARARDMFFHGDAHFLLYTERYHFFNRARVKGIRHLVFYQPPIFPHFYYEMCNLMQEANMNKKIGSTSNMTVTILYSKYDAQYLANIVGTERATRMVQSDRNVHMLVTDGK